MYLLSVIDVLHYIAVLECVDKEVVYLSVPLVLQCIAVLRCVALEMCRQGGTLSVSVAHVLQYMYIWDT